MFNALFCYRPNTEVHSTISNPGNTQSLSAPGEISKSGFSQFNSFLRRSSAAFIGDVSHVRQGNRTGYATINILRKFNLKIGQ